MKKLIVLTAITALFGCATQHSYEAAPQSYRAKNSDSVYNITGIADVSEKYGFFTDSASVSITIKFDGEGVIFGNLDSALSGDFNGRDYKGHKTASTCTGKATSQNTVEVRCMVFVDNERSVTLTF